MMETQFFVRMKGELGRNLAEFRERVGLERRGRLDDDWVQEFGRLRLRSREEGLTELKLWRYQDHDWMIELTYERDPLPADEAEELREKIVDAAAAAGMTTTAQSRAGRPKPPQSTERDIR